MLIWSRRKGKRTTTSIRAGANAPCEVLAPSIHIMGDVVSKTDLCLAGPVDGDVTAPGHRVTVQAGVRVTGGVNALSVEVQGEVHGSVTAAEKVVIAPTGVVTGSIRAPQLVLSEGCVVSGSVNRDMGEIDPAIFRVLGLVCDVDAPQHIPI
jgi:cytoskeletal protein CcmA (bactofilin family)